MADKQKQPWLLLEVTAILLTFSSLISVSHSWGFPEEYKLIQSVGHLVHPEFSSYNYDTVFNNQIIEPRHHLLSNKIDRSSNVNSQEDDTFQDKNERPLNKYVSPLLLMRKRRRRLNMSNDDGLVSQENDTPETFDNDNEYLNISVGDSIMVEDPEDNIYVERQKSNDNLTSESRRKSPFQLRKSESRAVPFVYPGSIYHPKDQTGSLRFPQRYNYPLPSSFSVSKNYYDVFNTPKQSLPQRTAKRKLPQSQFGKLSLEDFQKAGGFRGELTKLGDYAFDGHGSIVFKQPNVPSVPVIEKTKLNHKTSVNSRPTATISSSMFNIRPSRNAIYRQDVQNIGKTKKPRPSTLPPKRTRGRRKKYFHNIAEIIQAHEEEEAKRLEEQLLKNREKSKRVLSSRVRGTPDVGRTPNSHSAINFGSFNFPNYDNPYQNDRVRIKGPNPRQHINNNIHASESFTHSHSDPISFLPKPDNKKHSLTPSQTFVNQPFVHAPHLSSLDGIGTQFFVNGDIFNRDHPAHIDPPKHLSHDHTAHDLKHDAHHHAIEGKFDAPSQDHHPHHSYVHVESTKHDAHQGYYKPASYKFGYDVKSPKHHTRYQHKEARKGDTVSGEYRVALPDGRIQIVSYTADDTGFHPVITYVEAGDVGHHPHGAAGNEKLHDDGHSVSHNVFNTYKAPHH